MRGSEAVESMFNKQGSQEGYHSSDSDDFFGSSENSKSGKILSFYNSSAEVVVAQVIPRVWGLNCLRGWHD